MAAPTTPRRRFYGLMQALQEGGLISWTVFIILVIMSISLLHPVHQAAAAAEDHQPGQQGPSQFLELAQPARGGEQARDSAAPIARSSRTRWSPRTSMAS
jgi:hypothetical protein